MKGWDDELTHPPHTAGSTLELDPKDLQGFVGSIGDLAGDFWSKSFPAKRPSGPRLSKFSPKRSEFLVVI